MSGHGKKRLPREATPLLLRLDADVGVGLQEQIRQKLIDAILDGVFPSGRRLPSSRALGRQLGVARNTVVLACQQLIADGYIIARERSGLFVNEAMTKGRRAVGKVGGPSAAAPSTAWHDKIRNAAIGGGEQRISPDWRKYPFPFLEGRFDPALFPIAEWREASRLALRAGEVQHWATDTGEADDPLLVKEICTKVLPRRGIRAQPGEILITAGTQQALHLLSELLADSSTRVVLEEPGNPPVHTLMKRRGARIAFQPVDEDGLVIDDALNGADLIYTTPSHQRPTAATLSMPRRETLLAKARAHDFIVIEDDFECETSYLDDAYPALRSLEGGERAIYVANLSRVLAPGPAPRLHRGAAGDRHRGAPPAHAADAPPPAQQPAHRRILHFARPLRYDHAAHRPRIPRAACWRCATRSTTICRNPSLSRPCVAAPPSGCRGRAASMPATSPAPRNRAAC